MLKELPISTTTLCLLGTEDTFLIARQSSLKSAYRSAWLRSWDVEGNYGPGLIASFQGLGMQGTLSSGNE